MPCTFDNSDIFQCAAGSPHSVIVGGLEVQRKNQAYVGTEGLESTVLGTRGRMVRVSGTLLGDTYAAVLAAIGAIDAKAKARSTGPEAGFSFATHHAGVTLGDCVIERFAPEPIRAVIEGGQKRFMCDYECLMRSLTGVI